MLPLLSLRTAPRPLDCIEGTKCLEVPTTRGLLVCCTIDSISTLPRCYALVYEEALGKDVAGCRFVFACYPGQTLKREARKEQRPISSSAFIIHQLIFYQTDCTPRPEAQRSFLKAMVLRLHTLRTNSITRQVRKMSSISSKLTYFGPYEITSQVRLLCTAEM